MSEISDLQRQDAAGTDRAEDAHAKLEQALAMLTRLLEAVQRRRSYPLERAQYLLILLLEREGTLSIGEAARRLMLDESTATRQIAGMEQQGLVRKTVNPEDTRSALVSVTPEGSQRAAAMRAERMQRVAVLVASWTVEEREQAAEVLARLNKSLFEVLMRPD